MDHEYARTLLTKKLFAQRPDATKYESYYLGTNPLVWISAETRDEIANYGSLNLNYSRVVVDQLAQKLEVTGFTTTNGQDEALFDLWERMDMSSKSQIVHTDALTFGRSFYLVWSGPDGGPNVTPESSLECAVLRDPLSGRTVAGLKRWVELDGTIRALLFTEEDVTEYETKGNALSDPLLAVQTVWNAALAEMDLVRSEPNPFGVVPLVPVVNRPRLLDADGSSELVDVVPLVDMLNKLTLDSLVTSSYSAFPRRYVTGLFPSSGIGPTGEQTDAVGEQVKTKWQNAAQSRVWIAPHESTKMGQFPEASMEGYRSLILLTLAQISAIGAIPPGFLSVLGMNPQSAEALKAQESRLVARAVQCQRQFSEPYEAVMRLAMQVSTGTVDPGLADIETVWRPAQENSLAAEADAISKLYSSGILTRDASLTALGYSPQEIATIIKTGTPNVITF